MRANKLSSLRASFTIAFLIVAAALSLITCSGSSGGGSPDDSGGGQQPTIVTSKLEDTTIPLEIFETELKAGEPLTSSVHVQLPQDLQVDLLEGFSINSEATLQNITITRTDGLATPDPTVDFALSVAVGDAPGACTAGGTQAFHVGITGNEDFSSTDVTTDESTMSQDAFDVMKNRDFTLCTSATSSVDVDLTITGINLSYIVKQSCDAPQSLAGKWTGTFYCVDVCDGIENTTPECDIELTIMQSDGAAIYTDWGGAQYFGTVCGTSFTHSGLGSDYYEWGTLTLTGPDTAEKVSTWVAFDDPSCGGTCYDTLTRSP